MLWAMATASAMVWASSRRENSYKYNPNKKWIKKKSKLSLNPNRWKFEKFKKENPDSRMWRRERIEQKTRNQLVRAIKSWNENKEKQARIKYLLEKIDWKETLNEKDLNFIIWLPAEDLEKFTSEIKKRLTHHREIINRGWLDNYTTFTYRIFSKVDSEKKILEYIEQHTKSTNNESKDDFESIAYWNWDEEE